LHFQISLKLIASKARYGVSASVAAVLEEACAGIRRLPRQDSEKRRGVRKPAMVPSRKSSPRMIGCNGVGDCVGSLMPVHPSVGAVAKVWHIFSRDRNNIRHFTSDLIFVGRIPAIVVEWVVRPDGDTPTVTIPLDPLCLHKIMGWGEAEYMYQLPVQDPRLTERGIRHWAIPTDPDIASTHALAPA
jgi:hypothetical protein